MSKKIGAVITVILVLLAAIAIGLNFNASTSEFDPLVSLIKLVVCFIVIGYVLWDYNIPHDNMFKYVVLLYALGLIPSAYVFAQAGDATAVAIYSAVMALVGYMAGRLGKIKKNIVIIVIVTALLAVKLVLDLGAVTSFLTFLSVASTLILWLAIVVAYVSFFRAHKEAGQAEDAK